MNPYKENLQITAKDLKGIFSVGKFESWEQTKQEMETAIDEKFPFGTLRLRHC